MARYVEMKRRRFVQAAAALAMVGVREVDAQALPAIASLDAWLAGRKPVFERIKLAIPAIADNGFAVPMRVSVDGPFAPGPHVKAIRLFSETNPVPDMAVFEFPVPIERVEIESRIRLAGTQHVVAAAEMTDGRIHAVATEVIVTLAGCMDGT